MLLICLLPEITTILLGSWYPSLISTTMLLADFIFSLLGDSGLLLLVGVYGFSPFLPVFGVVALSSSTCESLFTSVRFTPFKIICCFACCMKFIRACITCSVVADLMNFSGSPVGITMSSFRASNFSSSGLCSTCFDFSFLVDYCGLPLAFCMSFVALYTRANSCFIYS